MGYKRAGLLVRVLAYASLILTLPHIVRSQPARFIVELSEPPAIDLAMEDAPKISPRFLRPHLRTYAIRARLQQQALRQSLERRGSRIVDRLEAILNAFIVTLPEERAAELLAIPGVRRLWRAYPVQRMMVHALELHRVRQAWFHIGDESVAGRGVKIAIIDTGVDSSHPAFQDPALPLPPGYPLADGPWDTQPVNNKIIVARNYRWLLGSSSPEADVDGHGTAAAAIAAGVAVQTDEGLLSGVAPKAYLGAYAVFPRVGDSSQEVVLKALDDAVRDGMDIINLSLGSVYATHPNDTLWTSIVSRLARMGILVIVAAGNNGPEPYTLTDLAVIPDAITVGASWNQRVWSASVRLETGAGYPAVPGSGPRPATPLSGSLRDVEHIDGNGLACASLPPNSLQGAIAFILRGQCYFRDKLANVQAAGAIGALVYTDAQRPDPVTMDTGNVMLPAMMVSYNDGLEIKRWLQANPGLKAELDFSLGPVRVNPYRVAGFSSRGPSTDLSIKPDLVAVGAAVRTAGLGRSWVFWDGTSFAAPIVSGAAAVLKAARPELSVHEYRSLLINTASPLRQTTGQPVSVQQAGAGLLNLEAALGATLAVYPTSLSFGVGTQPTRRDLTLINLVARPVSVWISVEPYSGLVPEPDSSMVALPPRSARRVRFTLNPAGQSSGVSEGLIRIEDHASGTTLHVPYWFAVPSAQPSRLKIVWQEEQGRAGSVLRNAIVVRTTNPEGLPVNLLPEVIVVRGGGSVIGVFPVGTAYPGLYEISVRLGPAPGENVFRVRVGSLEQDVIILGY